MVPLAPSGAAEFQVPTMSSAGPRRDVAPHDDAVEIRMRRRVAFHDQWIVPRHDVIRRRRLRQQRLEAVEHFTDMKRRDERPPAFEILVEMRDVRGHHHPAALGMDAHELQAGGMAADHMQRDAGREFLRAEVPGHALREIQPHDAADIVGLE